MLYFIIDDKEGAAHIESIDYRGNSDELVKFLKRCHVNSLGMFGREEYAQNWTDYYNGKITREELTVRLENE